MNFWAQAERDYNAFAGIDKGETTVSLFDWRTMRSRKVKAQVVDIGRKPPIEPEEWPDQTKVRKPHAKKTMKNLRTVRATVKKYGPMTRRDIMERTGMSKRTVDYIMTEYGSNFKVVDKGRHGTEVYDVLE